MYERFTHRARKIMQLANREAQRFNHKAVATEHILLALIREGGGVAVNVLRNLDVNPSEIRVELEKLMQSGPDMVTIGKLPQSEQAKKVIELSLNESHEFDHDYVGSEHILIALLREQDYASAQVLKELGLNVEEVRKEVLSLLGRGFKPGQVSEYCEPPLGARVYIFLAIIAALLLVAYRLSQ